MTGIYVRICGDEKWQNLEVERLTDQELKDFFARGDLEQLRSWLLSVIAWIRDNVQAEEIPEAEEIR